MKIGKRLPGILIYPLLIATSVLVGWLIPAFYDWTGSDQSRPSPLIGQTALGLVVGGIIVCLALPWVPIAVEPRDTDRAVPVRFKIRTVLIVTATVAVVIAALMRYPMVVSGGLYGITLCYVVRYWILFRRYRWPTAALLACMYLPYVWIVLDDAPDIRPAVLWMASGLPAFLPSMLISGLLRQHAQELNWLLLVLTCVECLFGIWLIHLGPRRTIAYLVFVLLLSLFGSFALNALMRV